MLFKERLLKACICIVERTSDMSESVGAVVVGAVAVSLFWAKKGPSLGKVAAV